MVPQPVLHCLATFLSTYAYGEVCGLQHTVVHRLVPFVVALHPTEVIVCLLLITEERRVGLSTIGSSRGHTHLGDKLILTLTGRVGMQPHEVRRVVVVGIRAIEVTIGSQFVAKHIADTRCRTARTTILIKDGRKVSVLSVVYVVGALACAAIQRLRFGFGLALSGHERPIGIHFRRIVRILRTIHI